MIALFFWIILTGTLLVLGAALSRPSPSAATRSPPEPRDPIAFANISASTTPAPVTLTG